MIEYALSSIVDTIASGLMHMIMSLMSGLGFDMSQLLKTFPMIEDFYSIFYYIAFFMIGIIAIIALLNTMMNRSSKAEKPISILIKTAISTLTLFLSSKIMSFVLTTFNKLYLSLNNIEQTADALDGFANSFTSIKDVGEFTFKLSTGGNPLSTLIYPILLCFVLVRLLRFLLEIFERYCVLGLLTYSFPLITPTLVSDNTIGIFKKWCSMYLGQSILLCINVVSLKILNSAFSLASFSGTLNDNMLVRVFLIVSMIQVFERLDNLLMKLGLNVNQTGGNLAGELLGTMGMIKGMVQNGVSGFVNAKANGASGFKATMGAIGNVATQGAYNNIADTIGKSKAKQTNMAAETEKVAQNSQKQESKEKACDFIQQQTNTASTAFGGNGGGSGQTFASANGLASSINNRTGATSGGNKNVEGASYTGSDNVQKSSFTSKDFSSVSDNETIHSTNENDCFVDSSAFETAEPIQKSLDNDVFKNAFSTDENMSKPAFSNMINEADNLKINTNDGSISGSYSYVNTKGDIPKPSNVDFQMYRAESLPENFDKNNSVKMQDAKGNSYFTVFNKKS